MSIRTNAKTLRFHEIHGENVELKCNRKKAIRKSDVEDKGLKNIVFIQQPVVMLQPIVYKITKKDPFPCFALRIGFTVNNPYDIQENISGYSDCDTASGFFTRFLMRSNENGLVFFIYLYVKQSGNTGNCYYAIDDAKTSFLIDKIDVLQTLWAFIEISSDINEIELVGNQMAPCLDVEKFQLKKIKSPKTSFHRMHGRDICLKKNKTTACRSKGPGCYAYVFANSPFELNKKIMFRVNKLCRSSKGLLEYGITSNDPSKIPNDLPENTGDLLNFPNYWVIAKDRHKYNVGDVINFIITRQGKFKVSQNFTFPTCILPIDITQPLWLFIKLCGSISEISIKNLSTKECCDMIEGNQFIVPSGSDLCSYGSTAIVNSTETPECILCYEKPNDCVLYRCGHKCMCYECAESALRYKYIVTCPLCRAPIQDVIKMYS